MFAVPFTTYPQTLPALPTQGMPSPAWHLERGQILVSPSITGGRSSPTDFIFCMLAPSYAAQQYKNALVCFLFHLPFLIFSPFQIQSKHFMSTSVSIEGYTVHYKPNVIGDLALDLHYHLIPSYK